MLPSVTLVLGATYYSHSGVKPHPRILGEYAHVLEVSRKVYAAYTLISAYIHVTGSFIIQ